MKLLLADDHTLFRDALLLYIERAEPGSVVALAKDLPEALALLKSDPEQDLILLDLRMPGMNGLEGLEIIREDYPDIPVALMSGVAEPEDVRHAMDLGAMGYFPKTLSGRALIKAIQLVLTGEKFIPLGHDAQKIMPSYYNDPQVVSASPSFSPASPSSSDVVKLTPRESEVLSYLQKGETNKDIASALDLQVVTIKLHVRGICQKLGAKNRTQAVLKSLELGLNQNK